MLYRTVGGEQCQTLCSLVFFSFESFRYLENRKQSEGVERQRTEVKVTRQGIRLFFCFATSISLLTNRMSRDDLFSFSTVEHDAFEIVSLPFHFTFKPITNSQSVHHPPPYPFTALSISLSSPSSPYV